MLTEKQLIIMCNQMTADSQYVTPQYVLDILHHKKHCMNCHVELTAKNLSVPGVKDGKYECLECSKAGSKEERLTSWFEGGLSLGFLSQKGEKAFFVRMVDSIGITQANGVGNICSWSSSSDVQSCNTSECVKFILEKTWMPFTIYAFKSKSGLYDWLAADEPDYGDWVEKFDK